MDKSIFKSLRHRNFRLFFVGQGISVAGTWLQITAMPWMVYRLTSSTILLGLIGFLSQIPVFLLAPLAGVVADRYNKKKLLIITQTFEMVQAVVLGVLAISGKLQIWHIIVLAILLGIVTAFDMPTRQAFLFEMVGKDDLMNAIALNSLIFNSARLIGPAIAGLLIASFGEGLCFLLNGLSFIAVIIALLLITQLTSHSTKDDLPILQRLSLGVKYIRNSKIISNVLLLISVTGVVSAFPMTLMPVFVKDIYKLDAKGLGIFMSAVGIGALFGTMKIANKKDVIGIEKAIVKSSFFLGLFIAAFAVSKNVFLAIPFLAVIGYFLVLQMALSNTLIQLTIPNEMRGRIMGFFVMSFMGLAPIGSIVAGFLAHKITAPITVVAGGFTCMIITIILKNKFIN
ncbi:MAG: MFS transporter [Elusimicrobia bacterium]|nr:MFS transporter [Elusimicrobiota bacterium]